MSSFSGPEASELFNRYVLTISGESDRGAVLAAAALLDVGLETALKKKLVPAAKKDDLLFNGGYSPLRSFSAKIELAFRLGLITDKTRQMLDVLRALRNDFAHSKEAVSLNDAPARDRLRAIYERQPEIHGAILGMFDQVLKAEPNSTLTLAQFLETEQGRRAIFNVFFASNAMALGRVEREVVPIAELRQ
jgi:hypothetical protein